MSGGRLLRRTLSLAVPLYLASLGLSLIPATVAMLGVGSLAGARPWRIDLLGPDWLNLAAEIVARARTGADATGLVLVGVALFVLLPTVMLLQLVVYSFLAGGILERLAAGDGHEPAPPFWAGCRRWFWPFVQVGLLGAGILALLALAGIGVGWLFGRAGGPELSLLLQVVGQAIALGWLELARAVMVCEGRRSATAALARAARLGAGLRPILLWLVLALLQGGLLLVALQPPAVDDPYAVVSVLQALAFGQLLAFLGAWLKVLRLTVAVELAGSPRPVPARPVEGRAVAAPAERP